MLRTVFISMFVRFLGIILGFIIPAITIRYYSHDDFGVYSYLLTYLVIVSVLQSGFVATFRNKISALNDKDKHDLFNALYHKVVKFLCLFYLISIPVLLYLYIKSPILYFYVSLFITLSFINALYPIVNIYFDSYDRSIKFAVWELVFSLLIVTFIIIACYYHVNIVYVSILWGGYKGIFSILLYFYINKDFRKRKVSNKFDTFKFFSLSDLHFTINQIVNVIITILFMNIVLKLSNMVDYGYFSIYYRFVFFPAQLIGAVAGIIWIKYNTKNKEDKINEFTFVTLLFICCILFWGGVSYYFMSDVVYYYTSQHVHYNWNYLAFVFFMVFCLLKDYLSIYLNAHNYMLEQLCYNIVLMTFLMIGFFFISNIDKLVIIYSSLLVLQCLYYFILIKKGQRFENK